MRTYDQGYVHADNSFFKCWRCGTLRKPRTPRSPRNYDYGPCPTCEDYTFATRTYKEGLEFNMPRAAGCQTMFYKEFD